MQSAAEITPTFEGVTARAVEGVQWWEWSRWLAAVLPFSDNVMGWSGEHRGFVVETCFKNNESVIATQRATKSLHTNHVSSLHITSLIYTQPHLNSVACNYILNPLLKRVYSFTFTLYRFRFSPVIIILPLLHTHLYLRIALNEND